MRSGAWANTSKISTHDGPFPMFYWDYSIGLILAALLFGGVHLVVLAMTVNAVASSRTRVKSDNHFPPRPVKSGTIPSQNRKEV